MDKDKKVDSRIMKYHAAVKKMLIGNFDTEIPIGTHDDVGKLGSVLVEISKTLKNNFFLIDEIAELTAKVNSGLTLDEVLNHVYSHFRVHIPFDRLGFSLLEDNGQTLRSYWGKSEAKELKITKDYKASMAGSSLQNILETGQPRILNNLEEYFKAHPKSESTQLIIEEGMRSSLTCPLIANGKPLGFIFFSSMKSNTYKRAHVEIFSQLTGELAVIIEKAHLYEQLLELHELKNRFLGMAAHDLRGPIMVIKGFTELLASGIPETDQFKYPVIYKRILGQCDKMMALITDLLDLSTIESGKLQLDKQLIDVPAFLKETIDTNALIAKAKNIILQADIQDKWTPIQIDPKRIEQVIDNLIANAVKFSKQGTTITISAYVRNREMHVSVKDEGQGISPEDISKIFQPFSLTNTKPTAGETSTGLGLAIVKKIVEMHGGKVWVESTLGVGSVFTFSLPVE